MIDQYHRFEPVDTYTFVLDEQNPETGQFTMLPLPKENAALPQELDGCLAKDSRNSCTPPTGDTVWQKSYDLDLCTFICDSVGRCSPRAPSGAWRY